MANGVIYANPDSSFWFADIHINSIGGLDNLDTSKVTNMQGMFMKYPRRGIVDTYILGIEHLNTRNVTDMSYMFANRNEIRMISVGDNWDTSKVTKSAYMFDGCGSLHGPYGTGYDRNHIDIEYARLDSESVPGYLTLGK